MRRLITDTIPLNTKKGMVSKAVVTGKMSTNNLTKPNCRILGSSALEWLNKTGHK
ncbi:MAG: hypothetical protein V1862_02990 [Methanobacteriota archaeon]